MSARRIAFVVALAIDFDRRIFSMSSPEPGSEPLEDPKCEILAIELAAGLSTQDAEQVAGIRWHMPMEPGERVTATRSRIQKQTLRRVDARLRVLTELCRGVDAMEHSEFLLRQRRAIAELTWFRLVLDCSGVEPDFDDDGKQIVRLNKTTNSKPIEKELTT
jgi:hypothetical protein